MSARRRRQGKRPDPECLLADNGVICLTVRQGITGA